LITPAILTVGTYYALGKDISPLREILYNNLFAAAGEHYFPVWVLAGLVLLGLIILVSLIHLFSLLNNKKIKSRKTFNLLIWTLVLSFVVYFALPSASVDLILLAGIPISYILAHYFIFSRKKLLPEIFFAVLFLIIVFMQIWYL